MVYMYAMLLLLHSTFKLSVVKMLLKCVVGGLSLNIHRNYIVDYGKIMELCFWITVGTLPGKHCLSHGMCLYQVMMILHFLNDVANDAESTQKSKITS